MSKASRLKGLCNRLIAIFELPAHQAKVWWRSSWFWERGFRRLNVWLLSSGGFSAVVFGNASGLCGRFLPGQRGA